MSSSLSSPWIKTTVTKLLSEKPKGSIRGHLPNKKTVQVTRIYSELNVIEISDKISHISVVLTGATVKHLQSQDAFSSLDSLRNSIVKIQNWHISPVAQCIDAKNVRKAVQMGITMPFAIQCDKIELLGAEDCIIFGNPTDINKDHDVLLSLSKFNYATMMQQLVTAQFPGEFSLPNADGQFCISYFNQGHVKRVGAHGHGDTAAAAGIRAGLPTPVARRTRSAPTEGAPDGSKTKLMVPAPADRRTRARLRAAGSAASEEEEEEDDLLLCLEDCIIPDDQVQKLLQDSLIFKQRVPHELETPVVIAPVASRTRNRNKQVSIPVDTLVDDGVALDGSVPMEIQREMQVDSHFYSQAPFLATQVADDVSGLEYIITQQEDACVIAAVSGSTQQQQPGAADGHSHSHSHSHSQHSMLSSEDVLFGPSHWLDAVAATATATATNSSSSTSCSSSSAAGGHRSSDSGSGPDSQAQALMQTQVETQSIAQVIAGTQTSTPAKTVAAVSSSTGTIAAKSSSSVSKPKPVVDTVVSHIPMTTAASIVAVSPQPVPASASKPAAIAATPTVPKSSLPQTLREEDIDDDSVLLDFEEMTQKQYPQQQPRGRHFAASTPVTVNVSVKKETRNERNREDKRKLEASTSLVATAAPITVKRPKKTKIGRKVSKNFGPVHGDCRGVVISQSTETGYYLIEYEDGDTEEMTELDLCKYLIPTLLC